MLRIGLLTSGGDCQALNATMRGIVKTLMTNSEEPIEIYGFEDGYQGLIYSRFRVMTPADFSGILTRGGTILGTSRIVDIHISHLRDKLEADPNTPLWIKTNRGFGYSFSGKIKIKA